VSLPAGTPVVRVSGGKLQLGVVVVDAAGRRAGDVGGCEEAAPPSPASPATTFVAVRVAPRLDPGLLTTPAGAGAAAAAAAELADAAARAGWWAPGRGDLRVKVEAFAVHPRDGRLRLVDAYGRFRAAAVAPLPAPAPGVAGGEEGGGGDGAASPSAPLQPAGEGSWAAALAAAAGSPALAEKTRLLRAMLQWSRDVRGGDVLAAEASARKAGAGGSSGPGGGGGGASPAVMTTTSRSSLPTPPASTAPRDADVLVLIWPSGEIARVPRGTTAAGVAARAGGGGGAGARRPGPSAATRPPVGASSRGGGAPSGAASWSSSSPDALAPSAAAAAAVSTAAPPRGAADEWVNLNNRLVPPGTPVADGDFVVLGGAAVDDL
jgi:hypothetical protein